MIVSTITAEFPCEIKKVWKTVTSLESYLWRSDINRIEILDLDRFAEYKKNGYRTEFTVTVCDPLKRWEFDMENSNIKGHWTGIFLYKSNKTVVEFTEELTAKKPLLKPFLKLYLKIHQAVYIADLKKALS